MPARINRIGNHSIWQPADNGNLVTIELNDTNFNDEDFNVDDTPYIQSASALSYPPGEVVTLKVRSISSTDSYELAAGKSVAYGVALDIEDIKDGNFMVGMSIVSSFFCSESSDAEVNQEVIVAGNYTAVGTGATDNDVGSHFLQLPCDVNNYNNKKQYLAYKGSLLCMAHDGSTNYRNLWIAVMLNNDESASATIIHPRITISAWVIVTGKHT